MSGGNFCDEEGPFELCSPPSPPPPFTTQQLAARTGPGGAWNGGPGVIHTYIPQNVLIILRYHAEKNSWTIFHLDHFAAPFPSHLQLKGLSSRKGSDVCAPFPAPPPPPLCDIPSDCCSFTGPWTVTCSSLRMLRRVATFCRPLRPVLLLVLFPRSRSPVVGVPGLC